MAQRADVEAFYGKIPKQTVRAVVVTMDGLPVGIMGIAREGFISRVFSEHRPELEPHLRSMTVMRGIKRAMQMVSEYAGQLYAVAQHDEGRRILRRLGFVEHDGVFLWPD